MNSTVGEGPTEIDYIERTKEHRAAFYGPWFAALTGLTLMMGVIAAQATIYFSIFRCESWGIFILVMLCLALVLTQWIVIIDAAWIWFIVHFGDYRTFVVVPWQSWSAPIIGQATVFVAQVFFAHRCYTLYYQSKLILACLLFGMLSSLALYISVGVTIATDPFDHQGLRKITLPAFCVNLLTDLSITGLVLWKLGGGGGESYSRSAYDILRRLRNLTLEAAVPPSIFTILNISFYLAQGTKNLVFLTFGIMTPSLYVSSLMFTLNARRTIGRKFNFPGDASDTGFALPNVGGKGRKQDQTESRRTTIVFAPMRGPTYAPNATMGIVDECAERGKARPRLYSRERRKLGDPDDDYEDDFEEGDEPTSPGVSHKGIQVDLDRWEKEEARSGSPSSKPTIRSEWKGQPPHSGESS